MEALTAAEAAQRLNVSVRRVQQLVKAGRLPATLFGGALMIDADDLKLVADRKPGRPSRQQPDNNKKGNKKHPSGT